MARSIDKLKKELLGIADAVNTFESEEVQLRVIEKVFKQIFRKGGQDSGTNGAQVYIQVESFTQAEEENASIPDGRGLTAIVKGLLNGDFFDIERSTADVITYCNQNHGGPYYTYMLSGMLLKLTRSGHLTRVISNNTHRYVYMKPALEQPETQIVPDSNL